MRIAWFTPFNRKSAIGHYSALVCAELRRAHEPVVFASDLTDLAEAWSAKVPVVCLRYMNADRLLRELGGFPLVVYNMGNHGPYHRLVYEFLQRRPGIVVLHDLVLRDFFINYFLHQERSNKPGLLQLMEYCHGKPGRAWLEETLARPGACTDPRVLEFHMAKAVEHGAHGVVVHSEFARQQIAALAGAPVARIDFPAPPHARPAAAGRRPAQEGGTARVAVLTFGTVGPNKLIDAVIEAIGQSRFLRDQVTYQVLGAPDLDYLKQLEALIARLDLGGVVHLLGPQPDERLHAELAAADVVVNLRHPHLGESSWSLLEALVAGKPTVVWNHGYYAEFPEDVVCKVASRAELLAMLENLCRDAGLRRRYGEQARDYAVRTFNTTRYTERFLAFAESVMGNRIILDLADNLADLVHEVALGAPAQVLLDRVARELGNLVDEAA
jgi:glycosyltransferase involved in cell wall biosynthesis